MDAGCGVARFPGPEVSVCVRDHSLTLVGVDPAGRSAAGQVDRISVVRFVSQPVGLAVCVQKEDPLAEGLGLDNASGRILTDARDVRVCLAGAP